jgi:hypothetical protein
MKVYATIYKQIKTREGGSIKEYETIQAVSSGSEWEEVKREIEISNTMEEYDTRYEVVKLLEVSFDSKDNKAFNEVITLLNEGVFYKEAYIDALKEEGK